MSIQAMKQVIELYDKHCYNNDYGGIEFNKKHGYKFIEAIEALRTAIQQAESEPVAWMWKFKDEEGAAFSSKEPTLSIRDGVSYVPLYTHPASGVPEDVAQDAQRYRWLRRKACVIGKTTYCGEETGQPILDFVNLPDVTEVIRRDSASTLDAAIDAAMLTAASNAKGES